MREARRHASDIVQAPNGAQTRGKNGTRSSRDIRIGSKQSAHDQEQQRSRHGKYERRQHETKQRGNAAGEHRERQRGESGPCMRRAAQTCE